MAKAKTRKKPDANPRVAVLEHREPALEAALVANPGDRDAFGVYADWLQSKQHPLGEVIALALAAEDEPARQRKLKVNATLALTAYIETHLAPAYPTLVARMLAFKLGPTAKGSDGIGFSKSSAILFRRGLIDSVETWQWSPSMRAEGMALLRDRHAFLVRGICLRDETMDDLDAVAHLHALEEIDLRWTKSKGLHDLSPLMKMTRLSVLDARASAITDLSPLRTVPLRKLVLTGCPVSDLSPLANHPTLEHLEVGATRVDDVSPLFACPRLCNVGLWDARVATAHAQELVRSIKKRGAKPSPGSDYEPYVSHNDADWYEKS